MAKRFIDTDLFRKPFVKSLEIHHKLLWLYLLTECNHAGIWQVELDVASQRLGVQFDEATVLAAFGGRIQPFDGGTKWFMRDFLEYQYGELNSAVRAHKSAMNLLDKYSLDYGQKAEPDKQSGNCLQTVKEQRTKNKEEEGVQGGGQSGPQSDCGGPSLATFQSATRLLNPAYPAPLSEALWRQLEANNWLDGSRRDLKATWRKKIATPSYREWAASLDREHREAPKPSIRPLVPPQALIDAAHAAIGRSDEPPTWAELQPNTGRFERMLNAHPPFAEFFASQRPARVTA